MPTLTLTDDQAIDFVRQLPPGQQTVVLTYLLSQQWATWADLAHEGALQARAVARERGRDWDAMTEDEREGLVDDMVHESR